MKERMIKIKIMKFKMRKLLIKKRQMIIMKKRKRKVVMMKNYLKINHKYLILKRMPMRIKKKLPKRKRLKRKRI